MFTFVYKATRTQTQEIGCYFFIVLQITKKSAFQLFNLKKKTIIKKPKNMGSDESVVSSTQDLHKKLRQKSGLGKSCWGDAWALRH